MKNQIKYLVTGATGKTGTYAINELLRQGAQVRALVHKIDERSEKLSEKGVEVVEGDLNDFLSLGEALKGISGVYFVFPIQTSGILAATAYLIQAAKENGVQHIVNMSQSLHVARLKAMPPRIIGLQNVYWTCRASR